MVYNGNKLFVAISFNYAIKILELWEIIVIDVDFGA